MTNPPQLPEQEQATLLARLRVEITPADLGITTPLAYDQYTQSLMQAAWARDATLAQRTAEVRYYLIGLQIRVLLRSAEELRSASGSSIRQGADARINQLRRDQAAQLALSGLPNPGAVNRPRSTSVAVQSEF